MTKYTQTKQSLENQLGEVSFRRKLAAQQITGEKHFDDEFDQEGIEEVLKSRMGDTTATMKSLLEKGARLEPYIEIGAERGQRSLAMENGIGVHGAAVDLSLDMLQSCDYYAKKFEQSQSPLRVCCDLYNAPFKSGSLPFVFGYQVLHHFPDPQPIVAQIHRILAPGGLFYIAEEPFKSGVHYNFYHAPKEFSKERKHQNVVKKLLDHFFAEPVCNELEYGIVENDEISPAKWRRSFSVFERHDLRLISLRKILSDLYGVRVNPPHILNAIWGGELAGCCWKSGSLPSNLPVKIEDAITCPTCVTTGVEPGIELDTNRAICEKCGAVFPIVKNVLILMPESKRKQLYSEIEDLEVAATSVSRRK